MSIPIEPHIEQLKPYVPGLSESWIKDTYGVDRVIKLASNECRHPPSAAVLNAIRNNVSSIASYPFDEAPVLRQSIALENQVDPKQVVFGAGSSDLLSMIMKTFAQNQGRIMVSQYSFMLYRVLAAAQNNAVDVIPEQGFHTDLAAFQQAIKADTRLIFIANPNNPTGTHIDGQTLKTFINQCPRHIMIVVDEAYHDYMDQESFQSAMPWINEFEHLVVVRTLSKAYGLAGLRFGYGVFPQRLAQAISRVRLPFNVSQVALTAAHAARQDHAHQQQVIAINRDVMAQTTTELSALGLKPIAQSGNFLTITLGPQTTAIYQSLLSQGIVFRHLAGYGLPEHIRISLGMPEETQTAIRALAAAIHATETMPA